MKRTTRYRTAAVILLAFGYALHAKEQTNLPPFELWNKTDKPLYYQFGSVGGSFTGPLKAKDWITANQNAKNKLTLYLSQKQTPNKDDRIAVVHFLPNAHLGIYVSIAGAFDGGITVYPQTGPLKGIKGVTERGFPLKQNIKKEKIDVSISSKSKLAQKVADVIQNKNTESAKALLQTGVDVTEQLGSVPLFAAIELGNTTMAKELLNRGASPTINHLHSAIQANKPEAVEILLKHIPATQDYLSAMIKKEAPSSLHERGPKQRTAYFKSIEKMIERGTPIDEKLLEGASGRVLALLLGKRPDLIEKISLENSNHLQNAVEDEQFELAEKLIAKGAFITDYILFKAIKSGNAQMVELLAKSGAPVDAKISHYGGPMRPMLMFAILDGNEKMVKALLANGANVDAKASDGETPLELAKDLIQSARSKEEKEIYQKMVDLIKSYAKK